MGAEQGGQAAQAAGQPEGVWCPILTELLAQSSADMPLEGQVDMK